MWLKPQGYAEITNADGSYVHLDGMRCDWVGKGQIAKYDTVTCFHCNTGFHIAPRMRPEDIGGVCRHCTKIICPVCVKKDEGCTPFMEWIARKEHESYLKSRWFA